MFIQKIAVKCIIEERGKILLMKESLTASWKPNTWSLPGGKIEEKETFLKTFRRELKEETGLKIKINGLFRVEEIVASLDGNERLVHHFVFIGNKISGILKKPDHHVAGFNWFSKKELLKIPLKDLAEFYYIDLFKDYFKNKNKIIDLSKIKVWDANKNKKFYNWLR